MKLHNGMAPSINRSSHRRCSIKKGALRNFAKFTGKQLYQNLRPATLLKKDWPRCFPVKFVKFLRTLFLQNTSGQLLLNKGFFKLGSNKSVRAACVCIVFFFHYFKYYGENIFSRITVLYLIAKVERKE